MIASRSGDEAQQALLEAARSPGAALRDEAAFWMPAAKCTAPALFVIERDEHPGLKRGDMIVKIDGVPVAKNDGGALYNPKAGDPDERRLTLIRDGAEIEVVLNLSGIRDFAIVELVPRRLARACGGLRAPAGERARGLERERFGVVSLHPAGGL
ncbi:MAG: hypothetical protein K8T20_08455 [Planctomycetes bacterium]|nr:hypothetical protein [Planctomycetota bacterium]